MFTIRGEAERFAVGYEIAVGLGALGWSVGVGARDDRRREAAVEQLRAVGVDAFGVPLDVTDDASVSAAARLIEEQAGRLDVLVNNAGITGGMPQEPTRIDPVTIRTVVETNVIGVIRVTNAMMPLLRWRRCLANAAAAVPPHTNNHSIRTLRGAEDAT